MRPRAKIGPSFAWGAGLAGGLWAAVLAAQAGCGGSGSIGFSSTAATEVSIVAFNILHGIRNEDPAAQPFDRFPERVPLIAAGLAADPPSIVLLQEVFQYPQRGYPDTLGTLSAALREAATRTPGEGEVHYVFGNIFGGQVFRDSANGLGQAIFTRLPILASGNRMMPIVEPFGIRTVVWARLEGPRGPIDAYNVHLQGPEEPDPARTEIGAVLAFVAETSEPAHLAVLAGDFNSTEGELAFGLLGDAGFSDPCAEDLPCDPPSVLDGCTAGTEPLGEPGNRTTRKIDYVWLRPPSGDPAPSADCHSIFGAPEELPTGGVLWPSDHIGVRTRLRL